MPSINRKTASLLFTLCALTAGARAQESRIRQPIDIRQRALLPGHLHPKARPEDDRGRVSPSLKLSFVTLMLAKTETQQADLDNLLREQQTPGSPDYHRWLTPEEFAQRFGVSQDDIRTTVSWLESEGLSIAAIARGRNWIAVSGDAARVESAFQTEIHEYRVNGKTHFANATEPSVPAALRGVIQAIRGLNDFRLKPRLRAPHPSSHAMGPKYTFPGGDHNVAPNDLATIYNIAPLYAAEINGSGQKLVIAGQTQINLSDIRQFRSAYLLPASDPMILLVPGATDPGLSKDDLAEADLDLEWSGAVARNASLIFVYASDVMQAWQYAIDQKLAPVISTSYGSCEPETPVADALSTRSLAQQANAQGITLFAASGDNGAADCADVQNSGLSVDLPGSVPEVTSVGGTEFAEGGGRYWNTTNDASGASAISYIPETSWNDSAIDGSPTASGGGASSVFQKPAWQTGPGVPADNLRHVPDVSLNASADHDGYLVQSGGQLQIYGGTSASAPIFAGIAVLLNHYLVANGVQATAGVGNWNVGLYALSQSAASAFHDITTGNNIVTVPCPSGTTSCSTVPVGYKAGPGYDQVTGLGSVDVHKLITSWNQGTPVTSRSTLTLLSNLNAVTSSDMVYLIATVTGANSATPVGRVSFAFKGTPLGSAPLAGYGGEATATLAVNGSQLALGPGTVTASYTDNAGAQLSASTMLTVSAGGSSGKTPAIGGFANGASFQHTYAPGMILSVFGTQLAVSTASAGSVPLPLTMAGVAVTINGVAAPLFYVSPLQLNIQIPYQTAVNTLATLSVNNHGQASSQSLAIAPEAPGIFTNASGVIVPTGSASRGQIITLYMTGAGGVSPQLATGAAPALGTPAADLPKPIQNLTVTVGGVPAAVQFAGNPTGLVGLTQVNLQVPNGIAAGTQAVVVSISGVASAPARLQITN